MSRSLQVLQRDVDEANSVSSTSHGHQFEIQLGHLCNNRCVFCSSGQLTAMKIARPIPLDPMIQAIEEARASGARRVTFLGGEPTLHRNFVDALKRCVELGFAEIVIFTNGVLLPQPGFIDKVLALNFPFEWRISIQGGNEAAHIAVTGRPDSFRRIIEGMKILRSRGQHITANMCVNEKSYASLPDYPALVKEYGVRQLHIDIIRPSSTGQRSDEYMQEIMTRYSVMAPHMAKMLERFEEQDPNFDVNIGNLPFCVLPKWAHRIHHGGEHTVTKSSDATGLEEAVNKYEWHSSMRRHLPKCEACIFRPQCTGIFDTYLQYFGDDEFRPISIDELKRLNAEQHHFVLLSGALFEPLRTAAETTPPEGWRLSDWVKDGRKQQIDARFEVASGASVALRFVHPSSADASTGVLRTERFQLDAVIEPRVTETELASFLAWLQERMSGLSGNVEKPLDISPLLARQRTIRQAYAARERAHELALRTEQASPFGEWNVAGRRDESGDAVVELHGPKGSAVEIVFKVREEAGRSRISVDAKLIRAVNPGTARSVVQEVVRRLKQSSTEAALT